MNDLVAGVHSTLALPELSELPTPWAIRGQEEKEFLLGFLADAKEVCLALQGKTHGALSRPLPERLHDALNVVYYVSTRREFLKLRAVVEQIKVATDV